MVSKEEQLVFTSFNTLGTFLEKNNGLKLAIKISFSFKSIGNILIGTKKCFKIIFLKFSIISEYKIIGPGMYLILTYVLLVPQHKYTERVTYFKYN